LNYRRRCIPFNKHEQKRLSRNRAKRSHL